MTTNNLIGYDPLAWMDGETLEDLPPHEPTKKLTKPRAKAKVTSVDVTKKEEAVEGELAESEHLPAEAVTEDKIVSENEPKVEVDVSVDNDGDIEVVIDTTTDLDISIEVSVDTEKSPDDALEETVEEVNEMQEQEQDDDSSSQDLSDEPVAESETKALDLPVEPLITLDSDATIKNVEKLYSTVKSALAAHDKLEINASDVTAIDTATLQLLVSLKKDAPRLNKTVDIIYPSSRFIESAKFLDLLTILEVAEAN